MTEGTPVCIPEDSYGIAKYAIELELRACRTMFGLEYVIFRPHNVFGPRQNIGDRYRNVIGIFMNQILQGQPMTIFGDGTQTRAFSYIGDVAPIMAEAIDVPAARNEVFNIGADAPCSLNDLAPLSRRRWASLRTSFISRRGAKCGTHIGAREDPRRLRRACRRHHFRTGSTQMAAWVRRHGARQSAPFTGIEILKNLPPAWQGG